MPMILVTIVSNKGAKENDLLGHKTQKDMADWRKPESEDWGT